MKEILNKSDLLTDVDRVDGCVVVSAKTGAGLFDLQEEILKRVQSPIKENLVSERIYLKHEAAHLLLEPDVSGSDFFENTEQ